MTKQEFMQQIERLRKNWGPSSYQGEIVKIIWDEIGHVDAKKLESAITRVISTYLNKNYPAGLDKIQTALSEIREQSAQSKVPSRFNQGAGYKKTENGLNNQQASKKLGDILNSLINS